MPCGCTDNNKLNNNKLSLESMQSLSIDEIINLYRQGYTLDNVDTTPEIPNINVLTYSTQCSGDPEMVFNNTAQLPGTLGEVQKGKVWAQRFYGNFRCLDFVQFYMKRDNNVSFHIEIRKDDGIGEGKPLGVPLINDSWLIMRTPVIPYSDIPTSWGWVYPTITAILPTDAYYWICFVPVDFFDSPTYRDDPTDDRFGIQDGTDIADKKSAVFKDGSWTNSTTFAFAIFKKPTFVAQCVSMANVSASPTTALIGEPVFLTTQASPAGQYTVEFYDTITGTVLCSDSATISQTGYSCEWIPSVAGVFQVKARVVGQCNSPSTTQVTINCSPMVSGVTANLTTVQTGQQVTLTSMVVPSGAYTIQFIKTDGTILASDTSSTSKTAYTATWTPNIVGTYDIVAKTSVQPLSCANQPIETVTVYPAQVLTSISPPSAEIQINTTQQFTAKDQNTNTITTGVTWARTSGVGSIDTTGLYSAGSTAGSATISATYGGITKTASITVTAPSVLTSISPPSAEIQINTTQQFTAKDQNINTITTGVTWAKTSGVGSIDTTGLYSAGSTAGSATISATYGEVTKTALITITTTPPTQVLTSISPASATIQINTTQQFTAKDQNTNTIITGVTWAKTSGVGSIDTTGLYSAGSTAGSATISATYGGITKTASITVTQPCTVISLVANPTSVQQGQSTTLTATVTNPSNTAGYNVDFKVDGYLVATRTTNSSGVATYTLNTSSLTVDTHNIIANVGTQCTSSTVAINVTMIVAGAGGGGIVIMAIAALAAAMFMTKKPSQEQKPRSPDHRIVEKPR